LLPDGRRVSFPLPCPNCGSRLASEFLYVGEMPDGVTGAETPLDEDFERAWLSVNAAGPHEERWFHADGCRRIVTVVRDTRTNRVHGQA
jgi:methylglutamate dehydrogenase subunit B